MRSVTATYADMYKAEQTLTLAQNALKNITAELKALDQMQDECYKAIKEILQRYYGTFVEKMIVASSLHDVLEKDWKLPKGLLGKDDPKKAD